MIWLESVAHGDALTQFLACLLLATSVSCWVVIVWKWRLLRRVQADLPRSVAAFWQAPGLPEARTRVAAFDRDACVSDMLNAIAQPLEGTLAAQGQRTAQWTRALRDALQGVMQRLQWGQLLLATAGSVSPFVGLLGTVWGIFNALTGMAEAGQITIDKVAGPVGEALVMTAAGLAVAIPAVLAYNVMGRQIGRIEVLLEGFAHDVLALLSEAD